MSSGARQKREQIYVILFSPCLRTLTEPKSQIFNIYFYGWIRILAGFTSRWQILRALNYESVTSKYAKASIICLLKRSMSFIFKSLCFFSISQSIADKGLGIYSINKLEQVFYIWLLIPGYLPPSFDNAQVNLQYWDAQYFIEPVFPCSWSWDCWK